MFILWCLQSKLELLGKKLVKLGRKFVSRVYYCMIDYYSSKSRYLSSRSELYFDKYSKTNKKKDASKAKSLLQDSNACFTKRNYIWDKRNKYDTRI